MDYQNPKYECLLFDVDDTLYPFSSGLSAQCTENIKEYMIKKMGIRESIVPDMCIQLYKDYGTTMAGLRAMGYAFDADDYHSFVHGRLPYENLKPDPVLRSLLHSLPIRKVIFSNANEAHVARILERLGLEDCFEDVICFETLNPNDKSDPNNAIPHAETVEMVGKIDDSNEPNTVSAHLRTTVVCKPFEDAFEQAFKLADINPHKTLFFDDSTRNLETAKCVGLNTVRVGSSQRTKGVDYALESIHNIREALPELWEALAELDGDRCASKVAVETTVRA